MQQGNRHQNVGKLKKLSRFCIANELESSDVAQRLANEQFHREDQHNSNNNKEQLNTKVPESCADSPRACEAQLMMRQWVKICRKSTSRRKH